MNLKLLADVLLHIGNPLRSAVCESIWDVARMLVIIASKGRCARGEGENGCGDGEDKLLDIHVYSS